MGYWKDSERYQGVILAGGAYILWGIFPIYWKLLQAVPALEILAHRIIWSVVFLWLLMAFNGQIKSFIAEINKLLHNPAALIGILATGLILNINWGTFIWAVNHDYIIQTSLGYYINPLVSVLLGMLFLKEQLSLWQLIAFLLASAGVLSLTVQYGSFPWVAITLALSFGLYGLLKKTLNMNSLMGLTLETMLTSIFALAYIIYLSAAGVGSFNPAFTRISWLLCGAGVVTAVPLLLFGAGALRLPLFVIGFLQYISPSMTLLLGIFIYKEPFSHGHLISFSIIWIALIIFTLAKTRAGCRLEEKILRNKELV